MKVGDMQLVLDKTAPFWIILVTFIEQGLFGNNSGASIREASRHFNMSVTYWLFDAFYQKPACILSTLKENNNCYLQIMNCEPLDSEGSGSSYKLAS
ncbi:hypothetical protein D910_08379 [Dendroctonus ponderosae]|uniref:Uncharacterized protein n=1 Tax=Dendroctonus ponderosae TaxID=77166 RepID=U4UDA5_DENPD|nr:hypothetical protein D910_08379 [Dendroctonus ponderosae]